MQKPPSVAQPAEEPEAAAVDGFDAVIVATDHLAAPPAGFDPLGTPTLRYAMLTAAKLKQQRWAVRGGRLRS